MYNVFQDLCDSVVLVFLRQLLSSFLGFIFVTSCGDSICVTETRLVSCIGDEVDLLEEMITNGFTCLVDSDYVSLLVLAGIMGGLATYRYRTNVVRLEGL